MAADTDTPTVPAHADWRQGYRSLARAIREVMHRHPNAAPLITIQQIMPAAALRVVGQGCPGCAPSVSDLLRPGVPADLAAVAEVFCGQSDPDAEFALGLDLMLRE